LVVRSKISNWSSSIVNQGDSGRQRSGGLDAGDGLFAFPGEGAEVAWYEPTTYICIWGQVSLFAFFPNPAAFSCSRHRDGAFLSYSGWVSHFHIFGNNLAMKHLNPGRDGRPKNSNLPSTCLSAVALAKAVRSTA
jgi:hypothetical protein